MIIDSYRTEHRFVDAAGNQPVGVSFVRLRSARENGECDSRVHI